MAKVIVAIDFGTSGTTYAFAFLDAKENIITAKWKISQTKNTTEIILNKKNEIKKFGLDCKKYLGEQSSIEEEFYHFTDIKMKLYEDKIQIAASNNNHYVLDLDIVISKILIKVKDEAINAIKAIRPSINECDIYWKVTVPAIWKNKSKEIMKRAAQIAGIFREEDQLNFFALEPEAAACDYVNEKTSDKNPIDQNNKYIVCDIGGGTVDISTHVRVNNNGKLYIKELYPPCGGNHGSTFINKKFMEKVIKKLFGDKAINELIKIINKPSLNEDIYTDYCILLEEIEEFKINIKSEEENEGKRINCSLFKNLIQDDISNAIENYNHSCPIGWDIKKYIGFKIYFPYKIMIDLTKEIIVNKVANHLNKILKKVPDIKSIIYAGSVSQNDYILSMIKKMLPNNLGHYRSGYSSEAVVKGAVIFGFDPLIIKERVSKYTLGIVVSAKWNERMHGKRKDLKYFDKEYNDYYCSNIFSKIIKKNQTIGVTDTIKQYYHIKSPKSKIIFYKSLYDYVYFIDEECHFKRKCIQFGKTDFNVGEYFDKNDRRIVIELKLGGTYIDAKIEYKGIVKEAPFTFSNEE